MAVAVAVAVVAVVVTVGPTAPATRCSRRSWSRCSARQVWRPGGMDDGDAARETCTPTRSGWMPAATAIWAKRGLGAADAIADR